MSQTHKQIKEQEAEDAIRRQSQACESEAESKAAARLTAFAEHLSACKETNS